LQKIKKSQVAQEITKPFSGKEEICECACKERQKKSSQQYHCHIGRIDAAYPFVQIGKKSGRSVITSENKKTADHKKTFNGNAGIEVVTQGEKGGDTADIT
jgi:hypothetical protein